MEIIRVTPDMSLKQRASRVMLTAVLYCALLLLMKLIWPSTYERSESLPELVLSITFQSIFFALAIHAWDWVWSYNYELAIDEDQISIIRGPFRRSVRKGEVRTVLETKGSFYSQPALRVSKYGRFGTRMLGFIAIPKAVPQYESIKALALSWKASN